MGKTAIIIGIIVAVVLVILASMIPPLLFDKSWWWLFGALIFFSITGLIGLTVFLILKFTSKGEETEEKSTSKNVTQTEASKLIDVLLLEEFADHFVDSQDKVTHEGTAGKPRTPVFHKYGSGYHEPHYHFLLNMNEPTQITKLKQEATESKAEFKKRVAEALGKFAPEPEVFTVTERERETPEGKVVTREKKQTTEQIEKEEEKKDEEEKEEI